MRSEDTGLYPINLKFYKPFIDCIDKLVKNYGPRFSELNGFSDDQLNYTAYIDNFIDKQNVADATIDQSANTHTKDICSLEKEMPKPHSKLLAFHKFFYEISKEFGVHRAEEWLEAEWNGHFYLHDAHSASYLPYCYAYDIDKLVKEGLYFIDKFNNQPPRHLTTFTDFVGEFVSWTANRTSGACGLPSFLIYSYYFWRKDVENDYYIKSPEYYRDQEFQRIIYKLNQPYLRIDQASFSNFSIFDHPYFESIFGGKQFPDGTYMIDYEDEIIEYEKAFMEVCSRIRSENMMTYPVISTSLLRKDGKFVDENFARWACAHNMKWGDSNFFVSEDVTSLSNCCRLIGDIKNLGYFNSIGGTALEVGSVKVNTINLARLAYESNDKDDYIKNLVYYTKLACDILDRVRYVIKRNAEKGLLPNYTLGVINMKSQYNTIGIIGVYETLQHYSLTRVDEFGNTTYTDEGIEFAKEILKTITDVKNAYMENKDYSINIEEIPGERAAAILKDKDQELFPNEKYELPLYGNQWVPLGIKTSLYNKLRLSAILDKACSGGSICHINVDNPLTDFDTAWKLMNYIADQGVTYFAYNYKISACEHNHGFYGETCPYCGEKKTDTYTRIVGYFVPTSSYSSVRKDEFKKRTWMDLNGMSEI